MQFECEVKNVLIRVPELSTPVHTFDALLPPHSCCNIEPITVYPQEDKWQNNLFHMQFNAMLPPGRPPQRHPDASDQPSSSNEYARSAVGDYINQTNSSRYMRKLLVLPPANQELRYVCPFRPPVLATMFQLRLTKGSRTPLTHRLVL